MSSNGRSRRKYYDSSDDDDDDEYNSRRRSQEILVEEGDDLDRKPSAVPRPTFTAAPKMDDEKALYRRSSDVIDQSSRSASPNMEFAPRKAPSLSLSSHSADATDEKALYRRSSDLIDKSSTSLHNSTSVHSIYPSIAPGTNQMTQHSVPPPPAVDDEKALYRRSSDLIDQTSSRTTRSDMPGASRTTPPVTSQSVPPVDEKSLFRRSSDLIDQHSSRLDRSENVTRDVKTETTSPLPVVVDKDAEKALADQKMYDSVVERARAAAMAAMSKNASFSERSRGSLTSGSTSKAAYLPELTTNDGQRRVPEPGAEYVRSRAIGMRPSQFIHQVRLQNNSNHSIDMPRVEAAMVPSTPVIASQPCEPLRAPEEAPPDTSPKGSSIKWLYLAIATGASVLIAIALGLTFALGGKGSESGGSDQPTATVFSPFTTDCNSLSGQSQPHVFSQCHCSGNITKVAPDIAARYDSLTKTFVNDLFPTFNDSLHSCTARNQALVWLASGEGYINPSTDESELRRRYNLAVLFIVWGGWKWKVNDGWLSLADECSWYGIVCGDNETLASVILNNNSLAGELEPAMPFLTDVVTLMLDGNDFHGNALPSEVGLITNLQTLRLNATGIHGTIPRHLLNLSKTLKYFDVADNWITGTIPSLVGKLSQLQIWNVDQNNMTGTIPMEIRNCTNLTTLRLGNNQLLGTLPKSIGQLTALHILNVDHNNITGMIPNEIGLCTGLTDLDVGSNQLHGTIPSDIGYLSQLQYIYLNNNALTGTIPSYIGNCSEILIIDLSSNKLNGTVPEELNLLKTRILSIDLGGNNFSAFLPLNLCGEYGDVQKPYFHCGGCACTSNAIAQGVNFHY